MVRTLIKSLVVVGVIAGVGVFTGCNGARTTATDLVGKDPAGKGFQKKVIKFDGRDHKYGLFVPVVPAPAQGYPVIIFLHGMGEGGNDATKNMTVGLAPFVADQYSTFPFIVIFPQSDGGGWSETGSEAKEVIAILDQVTKDYPVDRNCVTLTGLSTGGYGTWAIGATYKEHFSALVPMGSSSNPGKHAPALVDMPIRSYHNFGDPFAAEWNDSSMAEKVNSLGGRVQYFQTRGAGHDCWSEVYSGNELFDWMRSQRKRGTAAGSSSGSTPAGKPTSSVQPVKSAPAAQAVKATVVPSAPAKTTNNGQSLVPTVYH